MVDENTDPALRAPALGDLAEAIVSRMVSLENIQRLAKGNENAVISAAKIIIGVLLGAAGSIGAELANVLVGAEEVADPAFQRLAATAFKDITGVDLGGASPAPGNRDGRAAAARSLGGALMQAIAGAGGGAAAGGRIQPGSEAAESYVTWVTQMALEGWLTGLLGEMVTLGQVESLGDLDDSLANVLGLGRMTRAVMRPLLDAKVITPFRWQVQKTYRPELLAPGQVAQQLARGRWTRDQAIEELARQGYDEARIEAILNASRKFFGAADVRQFETRGHWSNERALQHLQDQGYDAAAAQDALRLEGLRRIEQLEAAEASALVSAYADRRIDSGTFDRLLSACVKPPSERALISELANVRRAVNVKGLSPAEARACVRAGILAMRDYRAALEDDGYDSASVTALELLLRHELAAERTIAELRAEQDAERARERAEREAERLRRRAEVEAERALARRGTEADLERAVVRGLIGLDRLIEVYSARYDADTVGILVDLVEDEREAYVAQLDAREAALQRGARRGLSAGDVERAYMENLLTLDELRRRLESIGFSAADAQLLARTAAARKNALDEARRTREAAAARAATRSIDLGRFERLVLRGARTLAQYDELLAGLGFDEASRAAMRELLDLQIAEAAAARELRAAAEQQLRERGLSIEQTRRAVLLGLLPIEAFDRFLVDQRFTADAHAVLMAELRLDLDEAEAARRARAELDGRVGTRELSLAVAARAARLGLIPTSAYVDRLQRAGFSEADVELQLDLLLHELAEVQAQRARREAANADAEVRGLSLVDVERAVRAGIRTIADYRARAAELGYGQAAIDDLVALLELELAQLGDARTRREQIVGELATRNLSLGQLEEAVTKGFATLDEFVAEVRALGYGADDAELLAALLAVDLEKTGG